MDIATVVLRKRQLGDFTAMANPYAFDNEGFLFPLDDAAADSLRNNTIDERTWLEVVDVPQLLQFSIRGPHIRVALRESGIFQWPKGELAGELQLLFLEQLKVMRTENVFFKEHAGLANRVISLFETAVSENRSVWLNF